MRLKKINPQSQSLSTVHVTNSMLCSHLLEEGFLCFICVIVVLFRAGGGALSELGLPDSSRTLESRAQSKYISAKQIPSYRVGNI